MTIFDNYFLFPTQTQGPLMIYISSPYMSPTQMNNPVHIHIFNLIRRYRSLNFFHQKMFEFLFKSRCIPPFFFFFFFYFFSIPHSIRDGNQVLLSYIQIKIVGLLSQSTLIRLFDGLDCITQIRSYIIHLIRF